MVLDEVAIEEISRLMQIMTRNYFYFGCKRSECFILYKFVMLCHVTCGGKLQTLEL